jgi:hypothetical protein
VQRLDHPERSLSCILDIALREFGSNWQAQESLRDPLGRWKITGLLGTAIWRLNMESRVIVDGSQDSFPI